MDVFFKKKKVKGILCGTSTSVIGFAFERKIRIAATRIDIPVICIEDFPGNYNDVYGSKTKILISEDQFFLRRNKISEEAISNIIYCPSLRFDSLRSQRVKSRSIKKLKFRKNVLWAGQPEFTYNIKTLNIIIPKLKKLSANLYFRAHPNDNGYKKGLYKEYLNNSGLIFEDITNINLNKNLFEKVSLVITQFSSVGIEAGFYSVPTLYVLFEKIGEKLLKKRTGSNELPVINHNASFVLKDYNSLDLIDDFLFNNELRDKININFSKLYNLGEKQLPSLLLRIKDIINI